MKRKELKRDYKRLVKENNDLTYRVVKLEGAFEMASNSRCLWRKRALDAEAQLKELGSE